MHCTFFSDGTRIIHNLPLTDTEIKNSELLRFAHASLMAGIPVGDKTTCWVDANKNNVEVWIKGKQIHSIEDLICQLPII